MPKISIAHVALLLFFASLYSSVPALAGTVANDRPFRFAFNGSDATAGRFTEGRASIAVDDETGDVYVGGGEFPGFVSKFSPDGSAAQFPATGTSSIRGPANNRFTNALGVAVDNSGGGGGPGEGEQGRLYVSQFGGSKLYAFNSSGVLLWTLTPTAGQFLDVAVDSTGHPWVADENEAVQYEAVGTPPAPTGCSVDAGGEIGAIDVDAGGNVYLGRSGEIRKYTKTGTCAFAASVLDPNASDVYTDQSTPLGDVFTAATEGFDEYEPGGALIGAYGANFLGNGDPLDAGGAKIAYSPLNDQVYAIQQFEPNPVVADFGSRASGAVPDVISVDAPTLVGVSTAHFKGVVNARNVTGTAHFEWKKAGESWATAEFSPALSLVADETPRTVEYDTDRLRGNTTYQVRLVTTNAGNGLHAFSPEVREFTTSTAAEAPAVTIESAIPGTISAIVKGSVNPKGDTADWRIQLSTDPTCANGFVDQAKQSIAEGGESPVPVEYELQGLLPSQHYCARIGAANSFGGQTSETREFETNPKVPSQVFTAFASPRLDTSVRLNGLVNPEGARLIYRFEYSDDAGATWISLADREDTSEGRGQITVGEQLDGLLPGTTYSYRFRAENVAGSALPEGEEKTFTTRSEAEVQAPSPCPNEAIRSAQHTDSYLGSCRGIELVNNPDKGNQNVFSTVEDISTPSMSTDGERILWWVTSGAPGGTASAGSTFLAERSASGWQSRNLIPAPAQQVGGANLPYFVEKTTPSFSAFVFNVGASIPFRSEGKTLVRLDRDQNQQLLAKYKQEVQAANGEITDDGAHVLVVDPKTDQLVDIGSGGSEILSLMPDESLSQCGLDTTGQSFAGWSGTPRGAGVDWNTGYRMIDTESATRAYFEVKPNGDCAGSYGLYERNREANGGNGETTLIDRGAAGHDVEFIRAAPDGREAYFATFSQLDADDGNSDADVYRWDEASGKSTCLTCVVPDANIDSFGGHLRSIMISNDFSHIYFQSREQLVPGHGAAGSLNTYVLSAGVIRFVAGEGVGSLGTGVGGAEALLSPDGNVLVFRSALGVGAGSLTADALSPQCFNRFNASEPCQELYRYDDRDGSLECVSCLRGGETTFSLGSPSITAGSDFRMAADGRTIAFATRQPLVPIDVNQGTDIYEWRNGVVHLISDGVSAFQKEFAAPQVRGVDSDGRDILFSIAAPGLTGFEQDGASNLYDARIGGGFVAPSPPVRCEGDSCQGPLQSAPALPGSGGAAFRGVGNVKEHGQRPRCRKARQRGRCGRHHGHKHRRKHRARPDRAGHGRAMGFG